MPNDLPNESFEEAIDAIRRGMADVDAGQTRPIGEFDREFRAKKGLPSRHDASNLVFEAAARGNEPRRQS